MKKQNTKEKFGKVVTVAPKSVSFGCKKDKCEAKPSCKKDKARSPK